jgi:hypothetical protein
MKPLVVKCPVTDANIIRSMPEGVEVPPEETIVSLEGPCCRLPHNMPRDAKHFRRAS